MRKLVLTVLMVFIVSSVLLAIPQMINFQGRILEDGKPVNGARDMVFRFYDTAESGDPLLSWQDEKKNVAINNGIFNTEIGGTGNPIPIEIFKKEGVWVEVEIEKEKLPRQQLISVGYAFKALDAETLNGRTADDFMSISTTIVNYFILPSSNPIISASTEDGTITLANDTNIKGNLTIGENTITIGLNTIDSDTDYLKLNFNTNLPILTGTGTFTTRGDLKVRPNFDPKLYIARVGDPEITTPGGETSCIIQNNAVNQNAKLYLITGGWGDSKIHFGDFNDINAGSINFDNSDERFTFRWGGTTFMDIYSNRLYIGSSLLEFTSIHGGQTVEIYSDETRIHGDLKVFGNLDVTGVVSGVPAGVIVMWSGSATNIPDGWALCDGTNGTPNLRGRFIVGYNSWGGDYGSIGNTGGWERVALAAGEMPSHRHYYSGNTLYAGTHSHESRFLNRRGGYKGSHGFGGNPDDPAYNTWKYTKSAGNHRHSFSGNTNYQGSNASHENRPPYYTLAFIIKL